MSPSNRLNVESSASIDADNPWPGLATFTEDQRAYFHGRDEEIIDLTQLAERRPLVVLFGQSGLGKSSILQAGVFPRLRTDGFCPIYLRLDHADGAPSPTEQIKAMVRTETAKWGTWTRTTQRGHVVIRYKQAGDRSDGVRLRLQRSRSILDQGRFSRRDAKARRPEVLD